MKKIDFFKDKYVLVTGSSSGIGYEIAQDFLKRGCYVGVHYNKNKRGANNLVKFSDGNKCKLFKSDFSNSKNILKLWIDFCKWSKNRVDFLINNAGYAKPVDFRKLSEKEWDKVLTINLKSTFLLSKQAMKIMSKKKNGRIINISSGGWQYGGGPKSVHYSVSKAAIEALTFATAKIGVKDHILVNAIRPGATKTDFHKRSMGRKNLIARTNLVPLKRMAHPDEISNAVMFLCDPKSSFITNSVLDIRGGE